MLSRDHKKSIENLFKVVYNLALRLFNKLCAAFED